MLDLASEKKSILAELDGSDVLLEKSMRQSSDKIAEDAAAEVPYKRQIVWRNVFLIGGIHLLAIYGATCVWLIKWQTFVFVFFVAFLNSLGVQAGAHRLWAHRSYKASFGLRLFLSLCHVLALQNDLYEWCRDHRGHHKWSDTHADVHNATRGCFYAHVGWLLCKKHPEVIRKGKTLDLSDLEADPIVMFQRQFYIPMVIVLWGLFPALTPVYLWNESLVYSVLVCVFLRYVYTLNVTWLVNSWCHIYGYRPYDKKILPVEARYIRHLMLGEGFHNYHHAFPWDYSASELGPLDVFNPATAAINLFHYFGLAWDLKKADSALVDKKVQASGDVAALHRDTSPLCEWATGLLTLAGGGFLLRYGFMLLNSC